MIRRRAAFLLAWLGFLLMLPGYGLISLACWSAGNQEPRW
mgnify:FL=1